jgi:hypothetical protein
MMFKEIISVYTEDNRNPKNTKHGLFILLLNQEEHVVPYH